MATSQPRNEHFAIQTRNKLGQNWSSPPVAHPNSNLFLANSRHNALSALSDNTAEVPREVAHIGGLSSAPRKQTHRPFHKNACESGFRPEWQVAAQLKRKR